MALALTSVELNQITSRLAHNLLLLIRVYDASKYPTSAYQLLLEAFRDPTATSDGDVERALRWKYGHWRKINYPIAQRHLAERIALEWRQFSRRVPPDADAIYRHWMKALKGKAFTPYITVTFLIHLLLPDQVPILDQHTFRAMNWLVKGVRPEWRERKLPRDLADLTTYTEFFNSLHSAWQSRGDAPTRGDLDKGLMVFGQQLKTGKLSELRRPDGLGEPALSSTIPRTERAKRPEKCPNCNRRSVATILYGLPAFDPKLDQDLRAGRVILGGCCVSDDDPAWQCNKCGSTIYRRRPGRVCR